MIFVNVSRDVYTSLMSVDIFCHPATLFLKLENIDVMKWNTYNSHIMSQQNINMDMT